MSVENGNIYARQSRYSPEEMAKKLSRALTFTDTPPDGGWEMEIPGITPVPQRETDVPYAAHSTVIKRPPVVTEPNFPA